MLSVLGIGGAGGNIANEASKRGFHVGAINLSEADLNSIDNVQLKLKLSGSEGAGHNRDEAIRLMDRNLESLISFFEEHFTSPSIDAVLVPFSTGGGTGSGISPMLIDILSNAFDKVIVAIPIIPDKSEVVVNQLNCLSAFEELSKLNVSVFPVDNEKYRKHGKNKMYEFTNESIISLLSELVHYTEKSSQNGVLDKRDLLTILSTKGIGIISETKLFDGGGVELTKNVLTNMVQKSWNESIFADIENERIIRAGMIYSGEESVIKCIDYEEIFGDFYNMPIDLFEGTYVDVGKGRFISILTGLSWCRTRLSEIEEIVESSQKKVEEVVNDDSFFKSRMSGMNSVIRKPVKEKEKSKTSYSDILNKYRR